MYGDYTTLYFNLEDIDSLNISENIYIHLEKINVWLQLNKPLTLAEQKFMIDLPFAQGCTTARFIAK